MSVHPVLQILILHQEGVSPAQPVHERLGFPQMPDARELFVRHLHWNLLKFAEAAHWVEVGPFACHHRAGRPVPVLSKTGQSLQLGDNRLRLRDWCVAGWQNLDSAAGDRVPVSPRTAVRLLRARAINVDRMPALHPLLRRFDHRIGGCDNMGGRTVVVGQVVGLGSVVDLEAADELHRRATEGIDILIVVTHCEEAELVVCVGKRSACQGGNQFVLIRANVLVLVYQYPAKGRQQP